jgi:SPX domain protein involved in polyphosphate accumulation
MKFGKQLELGCYEPWKSHYCAYARLKRIIKYDTPIKPPLLPYLYHHIYR